MSSGRSPRPGAKVSPFESCELWRARLLADRFDTEVTTLDPVRALLGVDTVGQQGIHVEQEVAYGAVLAVVHRVGLISHSEPFGPVALQDLSSRVTRLAETLRAESVERRRSLTESCDVSFVISSNQPACQERGGA